MNGISAPVDETRFRQKIIVPKITPPSGKYGYRLAKRTFDFLFAIIGSVLLVIPMLVIAILVRIDSEGPVFYCQDRLGLHGKTIRLWKFRSMRVDAEKEAAQWAVAGDARCTRVGRVLRRYHLDELPQIPFNILPGGLSFVGPRPEREIFYEKFSEYIDGFEQRLYVKPGLTGLAQVSGGYELKPEEKIIFDMQYIETRTLWLDMRILFRTIGIVLSKRGSR